MLLGRFLSVRRLLAAVSVFFLAAACFTPAAASAAEYVSVSVSKANIRSEPTTHSDVLWQLTTGYPLKVLQRKGKWLKVRDFEATLGWIFSSLVNDKPHRVVRAHIANLRSGPGTSHSIVDKLQRYDVLRALGHKGSWAHVREPGGKTGWVAKRLTWGW